MSTIKPYDADMDATERVVPSLAPRDPRLAPWRAFLFAQMQVQRRLDDDLRLEHGLSLQEYGALLLLAESDGRRLRMGRLAEQLTLSKSGATRLIDRLVSDGLVERASCSSDARGAEARLTDVGLNRLRAASPTHLRGIAEYFLAALDESDLGVIERAMKSVSAHLAETPGGDPCAHHQGADSSANAATSTTSAPAATQTGEEPRVPVAADR
jgi:DNA-binding MarR family transcriptional regulator